MDMASVDARSFLVKTTTIQGVKTNVVQCSYDDHIMIVVTRIGKMGTLLARKEEGYGTAPTFNIRILRALLTACAHQLIEEMRFSLANETGFSSPSVGTFVGS